MSEPNKTYSEELKETFQGFFWLLALGLAIWFVSIVVGYFKGEDEPRPYQPNRQPTAEDYERWEKQYQQYGNHDPDIDIYQQHGGR